jgi:DNA-binding transcriptional MocR family regulator
MKTTPTLHRDSDLTLTEQLAQRFATRIEQHMLLPGSRLPSVRECAKTHEVSAHTVVAAYDQLQARGLVEARAQRGYFVRSQGQRPGGTEHAHKAKAHPFEPSRPIDATALIRGMFHQPGQRAMPALGTLPPDWLDAAMLGTALRRVTQGDKLAALSLHYGDPLGDARLRQALSLKLEEFRIKADASQIITTVRRTPWMWSRAPCCEQVTPCWSTSPAGPPNLPACN